MIELENHRGANQVWKCW